MKKIVIFGASSEQSIGLLVGRRLEQNGHRVVYTSRSGRSGRACDILNATSVAKLLRKEKPDCIIHAAGVWMRMEKLGKITDWENIQRNILAKSLGALTVLDCVLKSSPAPMVIVLGGPAVSGEARFAGFTVGNGALWGAVQFAAKHTPLQVFYVEMPTIWPSAMMMSYSKTVSSATAQSVQAASASPLAVYKTINKILQGKYQSGARVLLGKKSHKI